MNLSKRLTGDFSATVRNRGRNYYWQGRVSIRHASNSQVDALVRGSRSYEVSLDWEDGMLAASCDCAHFESEPCKHLWAAILAAEARGHLSAASAADVVLDCVGIEKRPPVAVPKPAPPPAWKNHIIGIASRGLQAARLADEWPGRREILYVVDVPGSASPGSVVLKLPIPDRKADGVYARVTPLTLNPTPLAPLPLP